MGKQRPETTSTEKTPSSAQITPAESCPNRAHEREIEWQLRQGLVRLTRLSQIGMTS